jgi:hypothetical protein
MEKFGRRVSKNELSTKQIDIRCGNISTNTKNYRQMPEKSTKGTGGQGSSSTKGKGSAEKSSTAGSKSSGSKTSTSKSTKK